MSIEGPCNGGDGSESSWMSKEGVQMVYRIVVGCGERELSVLCSLLFKIAFQAP